MKWHVGLGKLQEAQYGKRVESKWGVGGWGEVESRMEGMSGADSRSLVC